MTGRNVHLSIDVATMTNPEDPDLSRIIVDPIKNTVGTDADSPPVSQFAPKALHSGWPGILRQIENGSVNSLDCTFGQALELARRS